MIDMPKEDKVINNTCNGKCSNCGQCCGLFIPFNDDDIDRIKKYVKANDIKQTNRINVLTRVFNAHCCFLDTVNHKCKIYPVRPYVCRDFMCNRQNWLSKRNEYESKAKYNSTINTQIMATFDDKIYNDYEPILRYIFGIIYDNYDGKIDHNILIKFIQHIHREDLLYYFSAYDENGKKFDGNDLLNI